MNISQHANRFAIAAGLVILTTGASEPAFASFPPNIVYTTADSGPGSLRGVIAGAAPGVAIYFALDANSVITLTSGPLTINKDLTIAGQTYFGSPIRNLTISGNSADRVINITAPVSVTLTGLSITGGRVKSPCDSGPSQGGGILAVGGQLTIANSVITGNQASCLAAVLPVGDGGGVFTRGSLTIHSSRVENNLSHWSSNGAGGVAVGGTLTISNSIVRGNTAATAIRAEGPTTIERSIISKNAGDGIDLFGPQAVIDKSQFADNTGPGIRSYSALTITASTINGNAWGGLDNYGRLALVNSTISGNGGLSWFGAAFGGLQHSGSYAFIASSTIVSNTSGDGPARSGLVVNGGLVEVKNSIVASNGITSNFAISPSASLTSLGYNLTNSGDVFTAAGDITGTLPQLDPLQDNGGPTPTHALLAGSPGIDAASPDACPGADGALLTRDQRNFPRPSDGDGDGASRCDIGAYEVWAPTNLRHLPFLAK